jgi:hypothetical protein
MRYINTDSTQQSVNFPNVQPTQQTHHLIHIHASVPGVLASFINNDAGPAPGKHPGPVPEVTGTSAAWCRHQPWVRPT